MNAVIFLYLSKSLLEVIVKHVWPLGQSCQWNIISHAEGWFLSLGSHWLNNHLDILAWVTKCPDKMWFVCISFLMIKETKMKCSWVFYYCWVLRISSFSMTVEDLKFTGFKNRRFSLIHFPYGFSEDTRFLTSVFSYTCKLDELYYMSQLKSKNLFNKSNQDFYWPCTNLAIH